MLNLYGKNINNSLILGTSSYESLSILIKAIKISKVEVVTVSLKKQLKGKSNNIFWKELSNLGVNFLPNTAGCKNIKEVLTVARCAREIFNTKWIKLEIIGDDYSLHPNTNLIVECAKVLIEDGFDVFPYCTDDIVICKSLYDIGCRVIMPMVAPIGTGLGITNRYSLRYLRERLRDAVLIVDAGIGKPSDACEVMEMGYDGILINSAVAMAEDAVLMAEAFYLSVLSGVKAYKSGFMPKSNKAISSTNLLDTPFWHSRSKT